MLLQPLASLTFRHPLWRRTQSGTHEPQSHALPRGAVGSHSFGTGLTACKAEVKQKKWTQPLCIRAESSAENCIGAAALVLHPNLRQEGNNINDLNGTAHSVHLHGLDFWTLYGEWLSWASRSTYSNHRVFTTDNDALAA